MTHWKRLLACLTAAVLSLAAAVPALSEGSGFPGFGMFPYGNGQPDGSDGQQQPDGMGPGQQGMYRVTETTLYARPSARSVRSGEEVSIDFDLMLAEADYEKISVIEQGTDLEYEVLYFDLESNGQNERNAGEQETEYTPGPTGSVQFSMNRRENEKCTIVLRPEAEKTKRMKVRSRMTLKDGTVLENLSDSILVYTENEVRSHVLSQACASGESVQIAVMIIGQEGTWTFSCYAARSADGGQTFTRESEPAARFTVNTHEQEPKKNLQWTVSADENCMYRIEMEVVTPDGSTILHNSDAIRVQASGMSL